MRVVIIGSGNVATVLGAAMVKVHHELVQVLGRNADATSALAALLDCPFSLDLKEMVTTADLYVMAVSDSALPELAASIALQDKLVVHTAGSVSKEVLTKVSAHYGVLYPLQSLRKENLQVNNIPLLVDANSEASIKILEKLATSLSANVGRANDTQRLKLHLAAVLVSNFTNHLYALAQGYCQKEQLDFNLLLPLINETANRLQQHTAAEMQTGPAARKDVVTIERHLSLLAAYPDLQNIYQLLSQSIMQS